MHTHLLMRTMSFMAIHVDRNSMQMAELTENAKPRSTQGGLPSGGMPSTMMAKPQLNMSVLVLRRAHASIPQGR